MQIELVYSHDGPDANVDSEFKGQAWGSAFLYKIDGNLFIVTARHNVTGRHWQTGGWLGRFATAPTHMRFGLLPKPPTEQGWPIAISPGTGQGALDMKLPAYLVPLIDEHWKPRWLQHPQLGADMDVAVIPFADTHGEALLNAWEPRAANTNPQRIQWPTLSAGQDVFIIGHPLGLTSGPLLPLWMRGTIASEPSMGHHVDDKSLPLMLIDARTRKGSSGSVVIRHQPDGTLCKKHDGTPGITIGTHSEILGVYSVRTHSDSDLGYVWRIDEVDEICRNGIPGSS